MAMARAQIAADFAVIGGGIVGLAVGARLSREGGSTIVLERHPTLLHETSGRNSGVVHAGIYYPKSSLKTRLCVEGAETIWGWARDNRIRAKQTGKWLVAASEDEVPLLQQLQLGMVQRNVPSRVVPRSEVRREEPLLRAVLVVESPRTGIVDVPSLAQHYLAQIEEASDASRDSSFVHTSATVQGVNWDGGGVDGAVLQVAEMSGVSELRVRCAVVNCAGLRAPAVANETYVANDRKSAAGASAPPMRPPRDHHYWVGRYATVSKPPVKRLIYPTPLPALQGLGTHATVDLSGHVRFGPDAVYVGSSADVDPDRISLSPCAHTPDGTSKTFLAMMHAGIVRYLPSVQLDDLREDYLGIRPKLSGPDDPFHDFEFDLAAGGRMVHCYGIESPGLTASPAIAGHVAKLLGL